MKYFLNSSTSILCGYIFMRKSKSEKEINFEKISMSRDSTGLSDSFWEPGNYKLTTKRVEEGAKVLSDLAQSEKERAKIETEYAKALKSWSVKWSRKIEKGPEFGTTEAAFKALTVQANSLADVHSSMAEDLQKNAFKIRNWLKENYHKKGSTLKERQELEDSLKNTQKPWTKLQAKLDKAKRDYDNARKPGASKSKLQKAKDAYFTSLKEFREYQPIYIAKMMDAYNKCQAMELKRINYFKDTLFSLHRILDVWNKPEMEHIYQELYHSIKLADPLKDLNWWSKEQGINKAMNWPAPKPSEAIDNDANTESNSSEERNELLNVEQSGSIRLKEDSESEWEADDEKELEQLAESVISLEALELEGFPTKEEDVEMKQDPFLKSYTL